MDQSSVVANVRLFLDGSLQKSTKSFLMHVLDHVGAERLLFRTNISDHCSVIGTTARARHERPSRDIAERMDSARSVTDFAGSDKSAASSSLGTSCDGGISNGEDVCSS